jgi:putative Mn2+ efflux pump MntP
MDILIPVFIGIGLSMDCFAVSLAIGTSRTANLRVAALIVAFFFGISQLGMTLIGWAAGTWLTPVIAGIDHWVAFLLLTFIGVKMIIEGIKGGDDDTEPADVMQVIPVIFLSFATSIDALAVGISFAALQFAILIPSLIIGIVASLFSFAGVLLGTNLVSLVGKKIEVMGGLILISIGLKILLEHLLLL